MTDPTDNMSGIEQLQQGYDMRPLFGARLGRRIKGLAKKQAQRALRRAVGAVGMMTATQRPPRSNVRRILVVRVDLLGDVVLSLPAVRALRRAYPTARVDFLALRSTAALLCDDPDVDDVIAFDPHVWRRPANLLKRDTWTESLRLLVRLRQARYDLAVSVSGDIGSIVTRLSGAKRRVGYAEEAYRGLMTDPVPGGRYRERKHEVRYVQALARAAGGIVTPGDELLRLHINPDAEVKAGNRLRKARAELGVEGPLVAIHAGARNGQAKRWPPAHIAALADRLVRELDALVVLTGAPNEAPLASAVLGRGRERILNLVGQTTIPELVAVLAASDVLVTGDSGPMHIACAVRTPVVALHGPTDPAISGPTAPDAIILRQTLWCSPCYDASATAECPFGNPVCMKSIGPDIVYRAVRRQLRRAGWCGPTRKEHATHVPLASHS